MLCPHGPTDPIATVDDDHADDIVYPSTIPFLLVHLGLLGRGSTVYGLFPRSLLGDRTLETAEPIHPASSPPRHCVGAAGRRPGGPETIRRPRRGPAARR